MVKQLSSFWMFVLATCLILSSPVATAQDTDEGGEGSEQTSTDEGGGDEGGGAQEQPEKKKEPPKEEPKPEAAAQQAEEPEEEELLSLEEQKEIESRIKVIQKKFFTKAMRLEISPFFGVLPQDSLVLGLCPGARLDFFITESFGLELYGGGVFTVDRDILEYANSKNWYFDESKPKWLAGLNLLWSPFYGKFSFLSEWLVNFDFFLSVGFTAVGSQSINRYSSRDEKTGTHPGGSIGLGWKLFVTSWFAPRIDVSYLFYMESFADPKGQKHEDPTQFRDNVLVSLGFSFYPY